MIKHIVMWKLHEEAEGKSKKENAVIAKKRLEELNGKIDGLLHLEVGIDYLKSDASCDLILCSELASKEALISYQNHPDHKAVAPLLSAICSERRVVDYEME